MASRNECTQAEAGHGLRGYKCGAWAPGFEQLEDQELPLEIRNLSAKVLCKRLGISLFASAANVQHGIHVGLGQPAEALTQTVERLENALKTLQNIERFACDQHDHVSFAKAWMLMSKGIRTGPGLRFQADPTGGDGPVATTPGKDGLRQTMSALLSEEVSELAWERAKLSTCFVVLVSRLLRWVIATQATYWSAVDLHKAVMSKHLRLRCSQTAP